MEKKTRDIFCFPLLEERRPVDSPRSVQACRLEGVDPEELLYVPFEKKAFPGDMPLEARKYLFKKVEAKRVELIEAVKRAAEWIYKVRKPASSPASQELTHSLPRKKREPTHSPDRHLWLTAKAVEHEMRRSDAFSKNLQEREMRDLALHNHMVQLSSKEKIDLFITHSN